MGQPLHPFLPLEQFVRARSSSGERPSNHSTLGFNPSCCLPGLQLLPTSTIEIRNARSRTRNVVSPDFLPDILPLLSRSSLFPRIDDRKHRSARDSRKNWGRFSVRGARGANVRTTCVGSSVLLSFTLTKSQSRLIPTRAASERPSNALRPLPSQPSLPPFPLPQYEFARSLSFFHFYLLSSLLLSTPFFFLSHLTADNRAITKDCKGGRRGWRGFRCPPGENKDASRIFLFIFFYPNRILFVARDTKGEWRWNSFSSLLVCDCSFGEEDVSSFFLWIETLLGSIIDGFGTGLFHFSPLVKRIILSGIISGDLIFNFSFPRHILVEDSDEWNEDRSLIQRVFTQARHVMRCSMDLRDS